MRLIQGTSVGSPTTDSRDAWIDCLRGYAIIIVCISHFLFLPPLKETVPWLSKLVPGDTGVQMFYVLSGFLITSVLTSEKRKTGSISLSHFYGRRFTRLIPSYFVFVVVIFAVAANHMKSAGLGVVNFMIPWLDMTEGIGYLPYHIRTLHIEEKFYLLWSIAFFSLPVRFLKWTAIAFLIYGPAARLWQYSHPSHLVFAEAADGFAVGIILCFARPWIERAISGRYSLLGRVPPSACLSVILLMGALRPFKPFSYVLVFLLPTFVAVLASLMLIAGRRNAGFLLNEPVRRIGLASYTIYLFQQFVLCDWNSLYATPFSWPVWIFATTAIGFGIWGLYIFVEAPITRWGRKQFSVNHG